MVSHRFEVEGQAQQGRLAVAQSHQLQSDRQPRGSVARGNGDCRQASLCGEKGIHRERRPIGMIDAFRGFFPAARFDVGAQRGGDAHVGEYESVELIVGEQPGDLLDK